MKKKLLYLGALALLATTLLNTIVPDQTKKIHTENRTSIQNTQNTENTRKPVISKHVSINNIVKNKTIAFTFQSNGDGWIDPSTLFSGAEGADYIELTTSNEGTLLLHPYKEDNGDWHIGAKIVTQKLLINNNPVKYLDDLEAPFLFKLARNGDIFDIKHAKHIHQDAKNFITQLLDQFKFISPEKKSLSAWQTYEYDSLGSYLSTYSEETVNNKRSIKKSKNRYIKLNDDSQKSIQANILTSTSEAIFHTHGSWIQSLKNSEAIQLAIGSETFSHIDSTFEAKLIQSFFKYDFPNTQADLLEVLNQFGLPNPKALEIDSELAKLTQSADAEQLLNIYRDFHDRGEKELADRLVINHFRMSPDATFQMTKKLNMADSGMSQEEELSMWFAIAQAGAAHNQSALLEAAMDGSALDSTRSRAITAIHDITAPSNDLIEGLWQLTTDTNKEFSAMAIFALGTMAGEGRVSTESDTVSLLSDLSNNIMQSAGSNDERRLYIESLFNAQQASALPTLESQFSHSNADIRAASLSSAANIGNTQAINSVFTRLKSEPDTKVKISVLESLDTVNSSAMNESLIQLLEHSLANNAEVELLNTLVDRIGAAKANFASNGPILSAIASGKLPRETRIRIFKHVPPEPQS